jgi:ubiquinone/menaquinone biosynthesis C-methylase UbiE
MRESGVQVGNSEFHSDGKSTAYIDLPKRVCMGSKPDLPGNRMRQEWDQRSRENAYHYIASWKDQWPEDEFLLSGERDVRELIDPYLAAAQFAPAGKRVLEIGCGVGRMSFALAKRFAMVEALDISSEMIDRARALQDRLRIENVRFSVGSGKDLSQYSQESMDFAFSFIVFQHIPEVAIIENYIREIGRVLKGGGLFRFQVNGYHRQVLPFGYCLMWGKSAALRAGHSAILHRPHIKFGKLNSWRGVSITAGEVQNACASAGLSISQISGIDSKTMWVSGGKV